MLQKIFHRDIMQTIHRKVSGILFPEFLIQKRGQSIVIIRVHAPDHGIAQKYAFGLAADFFRRNAVKIIIVTLFVGIAEIFFDLR